MNIDKAISNWIKGLVIIIMISVGVTAFKLEEPPTQTESLLFWVVILLALLIFKE